MKETMWLIKQAKKVRSNYAFNRREKGFPFSKGMNDYRAIFIHIPKSAGTSIRLAMGDKATGRMHLPWWVFYQANPNKFKLYFKFAFVRDPYARALSAYNYLLSGGNKRDDCEAAAVVQKHNSPLEFFEAEVLTGNMTNHVLFWPQHTFLCDWNNNIVVDYLGRHETIDENYEELSLKLSLPKNLSINNESKKATASRRANNREFAKLVFDFYRKDYDIFGYENPIDKYDF